MRFDLLVVCAVPHIMKKEYEIHMPVFLDEVLVL